MKKIKLFSALLALVVFTACDKDDESINNVYDEVNGQIGVGFTTSGTSVSVKPEGAVVTLGVQSTVTTTSDRNYDVMVNEELALDLLVITVLETSLSQLDLMMDFLLLI
jgi:hypothetical protein